MHAHAARRSSDVTVVAALRGGDAAVVCPYAIGEEVSWTGGGWWWPRSVHGHASAWCLRGAGLGSWRLDGAAHVSSKEGGSRGTARGIVIGCLAPASCWFSGDDSDRSTQQDDATPRRQAKGCDRQLTEAWMEHLGAGRGQNFTGRQHGEEQRKGTGHHSGSSV
jgi:hypothetical protein